MESKITQEILSELSKQIESCELWEGLFLSGDLDSMTTPIDGMKYARKIIEDVIERNQKLNNQ